jgi:hypothetical protein
MSLGMPPGLSGGALRWQLPSHCKETQDATRLARWSFTLAATKKPGKEIQDATRLARWSFTLKSAKGKPLYVAPNLPSRKIAVTT